MWLSRTDKEVSMLCMTLNTVRTSGESTSSRMSKCNEGNQISLSFCLHSAQAASSLILRLKGCKYGGSGAAAGVVAWSSAGGQWAATSSTTSIGGGPEASSGSRGGREVKETRGRGQKNIGYVPAT